MGTKMISKATVRFLLSFLALLEAEDMPEVFEIVNREADLTMNRVVVMIKEMGMQDQVLVVSLYDFIFILPLNF